MVAKDGISSQLLTGASQKLHFNKNGIAYNFQAKRLSTDRTERKLQDLTAPMTRDEQEQNSLLIFQVPLKKRTEQGREYFEVGNGDPPSYYEDQLEGDYPEPEPEEECCELGVDLFVTDYCVTRSLEMKIKPQSKGIEDAILSLADNCGSFPILDRSKLIRDPDYPIRLTIQFYQVSDTLDIGKHVFENMQKQIQQVYAKGFANGSLVMEKNNGRVTEANISDMIKTSELTKIAENKMPFGNKSLFTDMRSLTHL